MHPNEELARRELELLEAGDLAGVAELYADGFLLHYPGRSPLAGDYPGFDEFLAKARSIMGDAGTVRRTMHDAFGSDHHAVQLLTVSADVGGRSHSWESVIVMHVRDGKITEAWVSVRDQYALDEFLGSLGAS